ncbi:DMT family transporter [Nonomuraea soli]|uniref:Drug/metabolite transporter (DMT)-like permease n=1 Tax=Nonomuraea soli TaxID=1032476 RepID=A0A7W0CLI4_9ACTN|nr:DMT family transporter [Nonomuraea soli]MBA2893358.1 drug/metabolite transporter (DMT)-like permease [Nonomuraea soli]
MTVLAAAVALAGSLFFALGAAFQQFEAASGKPSMRALLRRPRWLLGGLAILAGGALHIVALGLGPLTVVQPMGVASLLFALPIAAALHGRRPARQELVAAAVVAIGLIGLVMLVPPHTGPTSFSPRDAVILLGVSGIAAVLLWAGSRVTGLAGRAALLATSSGVLYGATATLVRVLVDGGWNWWYALALPIPAFLALMMLQRAYAVGHFGVSFASLQIADPLTAVAFGALLLGEPLPSGILPILAAALAAGGTFALARTTPLERTH